DGLGGDEEAGDGVYTATLPAQLHRTLVRYIIHARDASPERKVSRAPRESDPSKNYGYFVYNGVPPYEAAITYLGTPRTHTVLTKLPVYHLIADGYDVLECEYKGISFSDKVGRHEFRWRGTFVYDGEVYDHIYLRLRGGVHRYHQHKRAYKIKFNKGRRFVMKDGYGEPFPEKRKKLNLNSNIQQVWTGKRGEEGMYESLGYQLFRDTGVRFSYAKWVHFRIIDDFSETGTDQYKGDFYGLFTEVEQPDDNLLKTHGHPVSGNFYKIDTGSANGKWEKEVSNTPPLDDSDIQDFWDGYHSAPTMDWWRANFNLDSWYSYHAIVDAIHHTDIGAGKNYYYYRNPETNVWEVFPWDLDLVFDVPYGGGDGPFVSRVLGTYPDVFGVEYKNRLREILQLIYTEDHIFPIIHEWRDLIIEMTEADRDRWDQMPLPDPYPFQGRLEQTPWQNLFESLDYRIDGLKNWILNRRATMLGWAHDPDIPIKPLNQSPPDGAEAQGIPMLVSSSFSDPNGNSHAASRWIIIEEGGDWAYPLWDSGDETMNKISIVIPSEVLENLAWYEWRVKHLDNTNRWSEWSAPTSFQALIVVDPTAPTAPVGLSAETPDHSTVVLTWGAASDPDSGILGYEVSRDGVLLATGLTGLSYTDDTVRENTSYQYEVVAINGGGTKSEPAKVPVTTSQDNLSPEILSIEAASQDKIRIVFDEPLSPDSANNPVNYRLTNWVSVTSAALQPEGNVVELTTTPMSSGYAYALTVNDVTDASSAGNPIASGTKVEFTTEFEFRVSDIRLSTGHSIITGDYGVGSYVYSDWLQYSVGSPIPEELADGAIQIRLPNAPEEDRNNKSAEYLTFNVAFDVEVWVGFRINETLPAWLSDGTWQFTEFTQYVDKSDSARYHDFYKKVFHRGEVALGGNAQDPARIHSNYIVVVRPLSPPDPDYDHDGMLDAWEIAWFGNISRQPAADGDLDGRTNFEEFAAGTNPIDSSSFFAVTMVAINDGRLEIRWPTTLYKYYQVYYSSNLEGEWLPLGGPRDSSSGIQFDDGFSSARERYYRIEVW
ncbi:CotH kinase family protein, partial [bacterium]|nr:CotH kinase family protein [bacterium]